MEIHPVSAVGAVCLRGIRCLTPCRDSTSERALKHLIALSSPNMTVESCLDSCEAGEYLLGGVEFGDECCRS
jgi:hypothetical protein